MKVPQRHAIKALFLLIAINVGLALSCKSIRFERPFQIGLATPLTGAEAQTGIDMRDGALLAIEEVNKIGGINGRRIELIVKDDKSDPQEAARIAKDFVSNPDIIAVIGHLNSDCSIVASKIYEQANLTMVAPVSTSDALTSNGFRNVFRIPIRNSNQAQSAARWISKKGYNRLAIIDDGGAYGNGIASEFERVAESAIKPYGGVVVLREHFNKSNPDFRPLIAKILAASADVVYFGGTYPSAALLLRQAAESKVQFDLVGGDGIFAPRFIEIAGKAAERATVTFIAPLPDGTGKTPAFYQSFRERFDHAPVAYAPLSYDAANIVLKALSQAPSPNRMALLQTIHSPNFVLEGVTGVIRFDESGENIQAGREPYFYIVKEGRFVLTSP